MSNSPQDAGIPVLTEIIPVPAAPAQGRAQEEPAHEAGPVSVPLGVPPRSPAEEQERWEKLEREVRERVLYQLLERIDFVLEQRVRDSLADVLQTAVVKLAAEIQGGLHETMKDVVTRAVAQEITKLQATKK
jgi:hypothetical protein